MEEFLKRNLLRTVEFLGRTGLATFATVATDPLLQQAVALMNMEEHLAAYHVLLCNASRVHAGSLVFCGCCGATRNFLRNHSLLLHEKNTQHSPEGNPPCGRGERWVGRTLQTAGFRTDSFCDYLIAMANKDTGLLLSCLEAIPLFWDAFLLLVELTDAFIEVEGPLAPYFYMLLKVRKDLGHPCLRQAGSNGLDLLPFSLPTADPNLLAAFLYVCGNVSAAHSIFSVIFFGSLPTVNKPQRTDLAASVSMATENNNGNTKKDARTANTPDTLVAAISAPAYPSCDYADIAAYVFFTNADTRLPLLIEVLKTLHPHRAETFSATGILHSSAGAFDTAKSYFRKSLRIKESPDVTAMLAHAFINTKNTGPATETLYAVVAQAGQNARLLYSVAQGFFMLEMDDYALFHARKCLSARNDGAAWKLVGRIHTRRKEYKQALHALREAERLGEKDALLYMAELSKRMDKQELVAGFYEAYVKVGEKNKEIVLKYLVDHFNETGDFEKSNYYREMLL